MRLIWKAMIKVHCTAYGFKDTSVRELFARSLRRTPARLTLLHITKCLIPFRQGCRAYGDSCSWSESDNMQCCYNLVCRCNIVNNCQCKWSGRVLLERANNKDLVVLRYNLLYGSRPPWDKNYAYCRWRSGVLCSHNKPIQVKRVLYTKSSRLWGIVGIMPNYPCAVVRYTHA